MVRGVGVLRVPARRGGAVSRLLRGLVLAGLWSSACPRVLWVSGYVWTFGLWLLAGVLLITRFRPVVTDRSPVQRNRLVALINPAPWQTLPLVVFLAGVAAAFTLLWVLQLDLLRMALPPLTLLLVGLMALLTAGVAWKTKGFSKRLLLGALPVWGLLLAARALLGGAGAKGLDLPVTLVAWGLVGLLPLVGLGLRAPRWLLVAAAVNSAACTAALEFYIAPFNAQVTAVTEQAGVSLVRHDPHLDFRWAAQGCSPGEVWMGARLMAGIGERATLLRNDTPYVIGGGTADDGAVDCGLRIVLMGDQSPRGVLYVVSSLDGEVLAHSTKPEGFESGITGVAYVPERGWAFGAKESDPYVVWLDVKDPTHPREHRLAARGTNLTACRGPRPCLTVTGQQWITLLRGPQFQERQRTRRQGRSLAATSALDEARDTLYVADFLRRRLQVLSLDPLETTGTLPAPRGIRYMAFWPRREELWLANFYDGWLYSVDRRGTLRRRLFAGRKVRSLNLSRDGRALLWCAASACFRYDPDQGP